jgi:phosphatidylserine/phosphatidylglycerophosphate/cardiolipin synthase-like enzyme
MASTPFPEGWPTDRLVFFSPRDIRIPEVLAAVLRSAQHSVRVNMFGFDDNTLDLILHGKATNPNIYFQMSLDSSQAAGVHEKVLVAPWASAIGTTVTVGRSVKHAISHLKVAVVDGLYVVSGSTNWSVGGEQAQDNELLVQRSPLVATRYSAILDVNHAEMQKQMAAKP